jgi:uncharacterized protein Veg
MTAHRGRRVRMRINDGTRKSINIKARISP